MDNELPVDENSVYKLTFKKKFKEKILQEIKRLRYTNCLFSML